MVKRIGTADFRAFVRTKEGEVLLTQARQAKFMVRVKDNALEYTVMSTMKTRPHETQTMAKVLDEFYLTGSFKTSDYQQITVCSSYTLSLIRQYLAHKALPATQKEAASQEE